MALLDSLEAECTSASALQNLRSCPAHASFMRRWKLSVYFSLRFQVQRTAVPDPRGCACPCDVKRNEPCWLMLLLQRQQTATQLTPVATSPLLL